MQVKWGAWQRRNRFGGEFQLSGHSGEAFNTKYRKELEEHLALKYMGSIRGILERASARETTVRVAAGALARQLLSAFQIDVIGYVVELELEGGVAASVKTRPTCNT